MSFNIESLRQYLLDTLVAAVSLPPNTDIYYNGEDARETENQQFPVAIISASLVNMEPLTVHTDQATISFTFGLVDKLPKKTLIDSAWQTFLDGVWAQFHADKNPAGLFYQGMLTEARMEIDENNKLIQFEIDGSVKIEVSKVP